MKLYEVEVGATYWVAADNMRDAMEALWECWEDEGSTEDALDGDYVHLDQVPPGKAKTLRIRDDGSDHAGRLMQEIADECEEPTVVACSEWP